MQSPSSLLRASCAGGAPGREPAEHARAALIATEQGVPPPCVAQLPYSLTVREYVEGHDAVDAFNVSGAAVVASFALYGGVLTGKYDGRSESGRMAARVQDPELAPVLRAARALCALAAKLDASPAALALAFALANVRVAAVLFGTTSAEQLVENTHAVALLDRLSPADLAELRAIEV